MPGSTIIKLIAATCCVATVDAQGGHEVVYTTIPNMPGSTVPGYPTARFTDFFDLDMSANGRWILSCSDGSRRYLIVDGATVVREGDAPAFLPAPITGIGLRSRVMDSGAYAFKVWINAPVTADQVVCSNDGAGTFAIEAREGDPIPGLPPGFRHGRLLDPQISTTGTALLSTLANNFRRYGFLAGRAAVIEQTTIPAGQFGGTNVPWNSVAKFQVSADASRQLVTGSLGFPAGGSALAIDGTVVIQSNFPLPGGPASDIVHIAPGQTMSIGPSGDWLASGWFNSATATWVVRNGNLVARTGQIVVPTLGERWTDDRFGGLAANGVGDWIVTGTTDADASRNEVLVLNGVRVIARRGDPIDLDGNGACDDDAYVGTFGVLNAERDVDIDDSGLVRAYASVEDSSGMQRGFALLLINARATAGSSFCAAELNSSRGRAHAIATGSTVVAQNSLRLDVCGLPPGTAGVFLVSRDTGFVVGPNGSAGNLCIGGPTLARHSADVRVAGSAGVVTLQLDLTTLPQPSGSVSAQAGEVWYWQFHYRDHDGTGAATTNYSAAVAVEFT